jgi:hypothetical protein
MAVRQVADFVLNVVSVDGVLREKSSDLIECGVLRAQVTPAPAKRCVALSRHSTGLISRIVLQCVDEGGI